MVTLPVESMEAIRRLLADGRIESVSGFVQHAVRVSLDDIAGWGALLGQALLDSGGAMTREEQQWADQDLERAGSAGTAGLRPGVTLGAGPLVQLDRSDRRVTYGSLGRTNPAARHCSSQRACTGDP